MLFPLIGIGGLLSGLRGQPRPAVHAVESVSFDVAAGETVALVGESGCGKSTVARCLVRLLDPTAGSIRYDGIELATIGTAQFGAFRRHIQMVFQDPTASLNPRLTARRMIEEPIMLHTDLSPSQRRERVDELLHQVDLGRDLGDRYAHELSGGQRQRVTLAGLSDVWSSTDSWVQSRAEPCSIGAIDSHRAADVTCCQTTNAGSC
jgi:ABC-type glutathione transport system ATPase component